jgi:hypothetical protein
VAAGIPALVIPNIVAVLTGATVVIVALRLRRHTRKDTATTELGGDRPHRERGGV